MSKPVVQTGQWAATAPASVEDVLALVHAQGGRATSSRRAILEELFGPERHRTAEEIGAAVQARTPDVHMSTIYRNLEDLQQLGVVVHSHLGHGPATYQLAASAHAHFLCEACQATIEAPPNLFSGFSRTVQERLGFAIDPLHFAMLGRCASCQGTAVIAGR